MSEVSLASFPGPAQLFIACFTVLIAIERWAGPGNEAKVTESWAGPGNEAKVNHHFQVVFSISKTCRFLAPMSFESAAHIHRHHISLSLCPSQCKQMVTGGHLPVTLEQAIFMAGLQLHIEVSY